MNIGIDMMGGDYAPNQVVSAVQQYLANASTPACLFCIGDEALLKPLFGEGIASKNIVIIPSTEVIGYNEHPTKALKEKPHSSISIGFHLLATGKIDAFISAGNTGAMLVGTMYTIKAIKGVQRPTIATIVPKVNGETGLIVDVGLNVDCKPEHLHQFAILGSLYAKNILGIETPKVGLLNVGEEEAKGNMLCQSTYPLLKESKHLHFVGNVEGRDLFQPKADVFVCDGFVGNIILKMAESIYDAAAERKLHTDAYFSRFHYENYGGSPILGVNKPVIIGHGISSAKAFLNMIILAEKMVETKFCAQIEASFQEEITE